MSNTLPGFMIPFGSNRFLTSRNRFTSFCPNIFSAHAPLTMPSPCSPLREPPNSSTRSDISSAIAYMRSMPCDRLRLTSGLMCRHPTLACP